MNMATAQIQTEAPPLRHIPLSYDNSNSQTSALRLILSTHPQWEHSKGKIEFVRFTDGITNTLLKAVKMRPGSTEEDIDNEAILLRAYGRGTEVLIDRERETTSHSLLAQRNLAPSLLARFNNGLLYKFIRGHVCTPKDLTKEQVWRAVARRLAEWHAVLPVVSKPPSIDINEVGMNDHLNGHMHISNENVSPPLGRSKSFPSDERINAITPGKAKPNIWTVMQKWIFALPKGTVAEQERQATLQKELERTVKELGDLPGLGQDGLVFGHCDLLSGNVIITPSSDFNPLLTPGGSLSAPTSTQLSVSFIDYEYATPCPAAFDIANHFAEWGGFDCDYTQLPNRTQRRSFLYEYLQSYYFHLTTATTPATSFSSFSAPSTPEDIDKEAEKLFEEVERFRGIPGFYWGIWALIQATISQIDFDYASYAETRLAEYWAWRDEESGCREREGREMPLREKVWGTEP